MWNTSYAKMVKWQVKKILAKSAIHFFRSLIFGSKPKPGNFFLVARINGKSDWILGEAQIFEDGRVTVRITNEEARECLGIPWHRMVQTFPNERVLQKYLGAKSIGVTDDFQVVQSDIIP